jgi:FtsP/CotA-like multicopper oxidase with cupredoxin domain
MRQSFFWGATALLTSQVFAGDSTWLSPQYKQIFQNPLPFPPDKAPSEEYTDKKTGRTVKFYDIVVKPFEQQVYPGLKPAKLVGYDGMSPGPTIRTERGVEAVVRFTNHAEKDLSVHLHGSYSRAPFDGWAEDVTKKGQYKDYCKPMSNRYLLPRKLIPFRLPQLSKRTNLVVSRPCCPSHS